MATISATTSPCVKTRGERSRLAKRRIYQAMREPELVPKSNGAEKGRPVNDVAAVISKLDVIMERLEKVEVLDQLVVKVASLTRSLEYDRRSQNGE